MPGRKDLENCSPVYVVHALEEEDGRLVVVAFARSKHQALAVSNQMCMFGHTKIVKYEPVEVIADGE